MLLLRQIPGDVAASLPRSRPPGRAHEQGDNVRGKQIMITAVIALVVVVGFNTYQAKKQG